VKVVDKFMKELKEQLGVKKISITLSSGARTWLARSGHDPRYGARPLTRLIQTEIKDILSDEILFGRLEKGGEVFINEVNDKLTFDFMSRKFAIPTRAKSLNSVVE
jgi:ATP-dependent Clp protease ATP-binding subunit ClpA